MSDAASGVGGSPRPMAAKGHRRSLSSSPDRRGHEPPLPSTPDTPTAPSQLDTKMGKNACSAAGLHASQVVEHKTKDTPVDFHSLKPTPPTYNELCTSFLMDQKVPNNSYLAYRDGATVRLYVKLQDLNSISKTLLLQAGHRSIFKTFEKETLYSTADRYIRDLVKHTMPEHHTDSFRALNLHHCPDYPKLPDAISSESSEDLARRLSALPLT